MGTVSLFQLSGLNQNHQRFLNFAMQPRKTSVALMQPRVASQPTIPRGQELNIFYILVRPIIMHIFL